VAVAIAAALVWAPAASATDVTITSFDGTKIAAHWFVGKGVGQFGIYKKSGGAISVVLDKNTSVPGTAQNAPCALVTS